MTNILTYQKVISFIISTVRTIFLTLQDFKYFQNKYAYFMTLEDKLQI